MIYDYYCVDCGNKLKARSRQKDFKNLLRRAIPGWYTVRAAVLKLHC